MDDLSESAKKYLESRDSLEAKKESEKNKEETQLKDRDSGFKEIAEHLNNTINEVQQFEPSLATTLSLSTNDSKISVRDRTYVGNLRKAFLYQSQKDPGLLYDGGNASVTIAFYPSVNSEKKIVWYRYLGHKSPPGILVGTSSDFSDKLLSGIYQGKFFEQFQGN